MIWTTLARAAELSGLSKDALSNRSRRGSWPVDRKKGQILYGIPETEQEAYSAKISSWWDSRTASAPKRADDAVTLPVRASTTEKYVFDGNDYHFSLKSSPKGIFSVPKQSIEQLVSAYSHEGQNASLQELARTFQWSKRTVREILACLGITHSNLPFTDEQLVSTDEDELVVDMVRGIEQRVYVKAQRKMHEEQRELATKAANMREFVRSVFNEASLPPPPDVCFSPRKGRGLTVVSHATDLHYGKDGWRLAAKEDFYSRDVCKERLLRATGDVMERASLLGEVDRVILGVGADWFHIDSHQNKTTKGTPQDNDGNYRRIFIEGSQLAYEHIEMWRAFAPNIEIVAVRGNHDYYSTMMLVLWLEALYRNTPGVKVHAVDEDRHYLRIGKTLLGLTHGDGLKDTDLRGLMAYEAKEMWADSEYWMWLTGHFHSQMVSEQYGVLVEHLPSLAGSDAWHHAHGYVGNRKLLMAHIFDDEHGPIAKVWADAKAKKK